MSYIQTKLDYADAVADWFLEIGEAHTLRGGFEEGLKCTYIAATILQRQNRTLSSPRLESSLRFIGNALAESNGPRLATPLKEPGRKEVCLHVLSEAIPTGGITSMATRWMRNDRSGRIHSLALLSKQSSIPDVFLRAVSDSGGSIYTVNPADSMLLQAVWLKRLANELATYVILHIGVSDVICGIAFGKNGGPPVLLVNYTGHTFWTGASIADLVLNVRGSAFENYWTATHRGISRYATVPIPLLERNPRTSGGSSDAERKQEAKKIIGIPSDSIVILTVGAFFKYLPTEGLDFVEVCEAVLKQLPEAILLAVGFEADDRWLSASRRSGGRIRALGTLSQSKLAIIHEAADVYIEGFPFGTTASLLEAGLKGIPVVLAPAQCPPPYGTDGVALDDTLERPRTLEEYKNKIIDLSKNSAERISQGEKIRNAITDHHTGPGWKRYLEGALSKLSQEHSIQPSIAPVRTPEAIYEYWSTFVERIGMGYEETLESAVSRALSMGLRPKLTKTVLKACREYRSVRIHRTIPLPLLIFLCNFLIHILPISWALNIFRVFSFLCRPSLLSRVRSRAARLFRGTDGQRSMYSEYREVKDSPELFRKAGGSAPDDQSHAG